MGVYAWIDGRVCVWIDVYVYMLGLCAYLKQRVELEAIGTAAEGAAVEIVTDCQNDLQTTRQLLAACVLHRRRNVADALFDRSELIAERLIHVEALEARIQSRNCHHFQEILFGHAEFVTIWTVAVGLQRGELLGGGRELLQSEQVVA